MLGFTREQAEDMAQAHAEGYHTEPDGLRREGCPECEDRPLRDYPHAVTTDQRLASELREQGMDEDLVAEAQAQMQDAMDELGCS